MKTVYFYRMDNRSVEQFAKDIEHSSKVERDIIERYVQRCERLNGVRLTVEDHGCDNSGKLLSCRKVNTKADFLLNGKPFEVKFNNQHLVKFRFKKEQLESYLKQGAKVLWVNGYQTGKPLFTLLELEDLEWIKLECPLIPFIPWGGKLCYEVVADDFIWTSLAERRDGEDGY